MNIIKLGIWALSLTGQGAKLALPEYKALPARVQTETLLAVGSYTRSISNRPKPAGFIITIVLFCLR
jgi:hypothetical protein